MHSGIHKTNRISNYFSIPNKFNTKYPFYYSGVRHKFISARVMFISTQVTNNKSVERAVKSN